MTDILSVLKLIAWVDSRSSPHNGLCGAKGVIECILLLACAEFELGTRPGFGLLLSETGLVAQFGKKSYANRLQLGCFSRAVRRPLQASPCKGTCQIGIIALHFVWPPCYCNVFIMCKPDNLLPIFLILFICSDIQPPFHYSCSVISG